MTRPLVQRSGASGSLQGSSGKGVARAWWEAGEDGMVTPKEDVALVAELTGLHKQPEPGDVTFTVYPWAGRPPLPSDEVLATLQAETVEPAGEKTFVARVTWKAADQLPDALVFEAKKNRRTGLSDPAQVANPVLDARWDPSEAAPGDEAAIRVALHLPETESAQKRRRWLDEWKGQQVTFKVWRDREHYGREEMETQPAGREGSDALDEKLEAVAYWSVPTSQDMAKADQEHAEKKKQVEGDAAPTSGCVVLRAREGTFVFEATLEGLVATSKLRVAEPHFYLSL